MLFGCARAGDGPKALDLMEEMKAYNIPRDIGAHNAALKAMCEGGMEEEANKMFNDMLARWVWAPGLEPKPQTRNPRKCSSTCLSDGCGP